MNATVRSRLGWVLLALLFVNAIVLFGWTLRRSLEEKGTAERVVALRKEVDEARGRLDSVKRRVDSVRANEADARAFQQEYVGELPTLYSAMEEVVRVGEAKGLRLSTQTYAAPVTVKDTNVDRVQINLPVSGNYLQLAQFLDNLEHSSSFITVDQVAMREQTRGGNLNLDLILSAYFRHSGEAPVGRPTQQGRRPGRPRK